MTIVGSSWRWWCFLRCIECCGCRSVTLFSHVRVYVFIQFIPLYHHRSATTTFNDLRPPRQHIMSSSTPTQPTTSPFLPTALAGKIAIVTGGGSGICYGITQQLLQHGASAIICGRREGFLQKASATLSALSGQRCLYKVCDVRDPEACKAVVEYAVQQFGRVDVLINGAAGNFLGKCCSWWLTL
eukprot:scaffold15709_cov200-Alexandrium_tamarense.AAC.2